MNFNHQALTELPQRYRANFINSLSGIRQAVLVGTKSANGQTNLAIFNSLMHIGANPPLYGLLFRPDTVRRDTLSNILDSGTYTLNFVRSVDYPRAHQTSAKYEQDVSEFQAAGFTEEYHDGFAAPFVCDAVVQIGMKFEQRIDIALNGTILIIGSIHYVRLPDPMISEEGLVDLSMGDVLACSGLYQYYKVSEIGRLPYARP